MRGSGPKKTMKNNHLHNISYRNFKRWECKFKGAEEMLNKAINKETDGEPNGDKVNDKET